MYSKRRWVKEVLLTLPSLMARFGQQLAMLVFAHLFSAFFDNTTQLITSFHRFVTIEPDTMMFERLSTLFFEYF
jgi:hypothetical protein